MFATNISSAIYDEQKNATRESQSDFFLTM